MNTGRWNSAIYNNTDWPWGYHAKQNKSARKSQEPYDFTHKWDIKLKATKEQTRKQTKTMDTDNSMVVTRGKQVGG